MNSVELSQVGLRYGSLDALKDVSFSVSPGSLIALIGESGAGKTSVLKSINASVLVSGSVSVLGEELKHLPAGELQLLRQKIGYIVQDLGLVSSASVEENVLMAFLSKLRFPRVGAFSYPKQYREMAMQALAQVGMDKFCKKPARDLSGGQKQRVAIARTVAQGSEVILADEPVSSLDPENARKIMQLFRELANSGKTVITSLHRTELALEYANQVIGLKHGAVVFDAEPKKITQEMLIDLYGIKNN